MTIALGIVIMSGAMLLEDHLDRRIQDASVPAASISEMKPAFQPNSSRSMLRDSVFEEDS
jgi:hypothetical protein